jgi:hypothetical protein
MPCRPPKHPWSVCIAPLKCGTAKKKHTCSSPPSLAHSWHSSRASMQSACMHHTLALGFHITRQSHDLPINQEHAAQAQPFPSYAYLRVPPAANHKQHGRHRCSIKRGTAQSLNPGAREGGAHLPTWPSGSWPPSGRAARVSTWSRSTSRPLAWGSCRAGWPGQSRRWASGCGAERQRAERGHGQ